MCNHFIKPWTSLDNKNTRFIIANAKRMKMMGSFWHDSPHSHVFVRRRVGERQAHQLFVSWSGSLLHLDRFAVSLLTVSRAIGCNRRPPESSGKHLQWFMTEYDTAWMRLSTKNVSALGFSGVDLCSAANTETVDNRCEKRFPLGLSTATNAIGFESQWRKLQLKRF